MTVKSQANWFPLQSIGFSGISGAYAPLGDPITKPISVVKFTNGTDATIIISNDGVEDYIVLLSNSYSVWDVGAMRSATSESSTLKSLTQFYVKGIPSSGVVYIESMYIG